VHLQICPDLARWAQSLKDLKQGTTPTAPAPDGTEDEIQGEMDYEAAAPPTSQGAVSDEVLRTKFGA
jgi:hypothetical protein